MRLLRGKQLTLVAVGMAATIATILAVRDDEPGRIPRIMVGAAIAAIGLTLLAEGLPDLAAGLSMVLLLSTLLTQGAELAAVGQAVLGRRPADPAARQADADRRFRGDPLPAPGGAA